MMDTARLRQLGLEVHGEGERLEATLSLNEPLANPVGQRMVDAVTFRVQGERLVPVAPPEVVGLRPIALGAVQSAEEVVVDLRDAFNEHLFHVQRRSSELQALGLSPRVDPTSLVISAVLAEQGLMLLLVADRQGNFRVAKAKRDGQELFVSNAHTFDLSEFRERSALVGYLAALFEHPEAQQESQEQRGAAAEGLVRFSEVVRAFGEGALVPPRSSLELLVLLEVEGRPYRFAAARVAGRTFRGLLAGPQGKVWAERFELDDFPGVVPLVADLLEVPAEAVHEIGAGTTPQE